VNSNKNTPRFLGAAFLIVAFAALISGILLMSVVGSGSISDTLVNISHKPNLMRISILGWLVTSSAIVVLAGLLYAVLNNQNRNIALIALAWWLAEAIFLALSQIGSLALIPLSLDLVQSGVPVHSFYQTLGEFLYKGVYSQGLMIHMWFYCIGGLLWYYLFFKSRYIPRVIPLWGLIAVSVALVGIVFELFGYNVSIFVYLPILPFELTIGVWLMLRGIRDSSGRWGERAAAS